MAKPLNWDDYRYFLAVARTGTISAAAKTLAVDHATVARRIERLERHLGRKLFDRLQTGYVLTSEGERVVPTAELLDEAVTANSPSPDRTNMPLSGTVRIGAPDGFGTYFLAPRIGLLLDNHPGLEIQLVASARLFNLSRRETDIAIALAMPGEGRVLARKLVDYKLCLYASQTYLDKTGAPSTLNDLKGRRFAGYIEDLLFTPELDYLPQVSPQIRAQFSSANLIAQLNATVAGFGFAVLPCFMADAHPSLIRVLQGRVSIRRSFWLLMHADGANVSRTRSVANFIYEIAEANRDTFNPLF